MEIYLVVIIAMLTFGGGAIVTFIVNNNLQKNKANTLLKDAESQAEIIKRKKELEAKERFLQLKSDHEKDVNQRNIAVIQNENRLKQIENNLKQKTDALTKKDSDLDQVKQ